MLHAAGSWSGDSWEGDSWDGSDLKWEGDSWSLDSWNGNGTEGVQPWSLNGWNESSFEGSIFDNLPAWASEGFSGNATSQFPGWSGAAFKGSNWNQAGFQGSLNGPISPYSGLPWASTGHIGSGITDVSAFPGKATSTPFYDTKEFNISQYVVNDIIGSHVTALSEFLKYDRYNDVGLKTNFGFGPKMYSDIFVNGFKLAGADNLALEGYDTFAHVYDGVDGYNQFKDARGLKNSSKDSVVNKKIPNITEKIPKPPMAVEKALSKLSVPGAVLGAVSSGGKTVGSIIEVKNNWDESSGSERVAGIASVGENFGDFLMSSGAVTAAVPGFQAAGGIIVAAGGALWVVLRRTRAVAENSDMIKEGTKKVVDGAKNLAKKGWKAITGLFGK